MVMVIVKVINCLRKALSEIDTRLLEFFPESEFEIFVFCCIRTFTMSHWPERHSGKIVF